MEEKKTEIECCSEECVHEDLLKIVNDTMPEETELYDLAELFKVFGDSTRIRILFVLFEAEVCVCDLAEALHMTQSAISHQLRILKQNKLVKSRREGKSIAIIKATSKSRQRERKEKTMETNETIINGSVPNQVPEMNPVPQKKGKGAWKAVVAVVLTAGVVGSTTLSAFNLATLKSYIATQNEDQNEETTEDYVTIAEQYEIKPTTNISDAYKSGDTSKLTDREKETLDMAKDALKEMKIKDGMSDFEKEKAVYDWMTSSLQYDSGALTVIPSTQEDCDNPYGVLKYHNAVCVGYATTFRMFMQMMDIECMVEHNTEKYHSWDLVKIDGDWYITDIYSDQGNGNYAHFNMTDAMWGQEQSWDHEFFPAANSLKYNMAYQNKETVDDVYDIPKALRKAMNDKKGAIMIAFNKEIKESDAEIANAIASSISELLMNGNYKDMPYSLNSYNWVKDPDGDNYLFNVSMGTYNTTDNAQNLSDKELEKVNKAVQKAFDGLTPADSGMYDGGSDNVTTSTTDIDGMTKEQSVENGAVIGGTDAMEEPVVGE